MSAPVPLSAIIDGTVLYTSHPWGFTVCVGLSNVEDIIVHGPRGVTILFSGPHIHDEHVSQEH